MEKHEKEKLSLSDFKKRYELLNKKYNLPEFDKLNGDFSIERASDIETDFPLREIRKLIADKYSNYMRFVEAILNPVNSPVFVFSIIKLIGKEEKDLLENIYKIFMKIELNLIELDADYSEKDEADFINYSFKEWQLIKKDLLKVIGSVKSNWDNKSESNNKGYFG